jgi:hypothetical protein
MMLTALALLSMGDGGCLDFFGFGSSGSQSGSDSLWKRQNGPPPDNGQQGVFVRNKREFLKRYTASAAKLT